VGEDDFWKRKKQRMKRKMNQKAKSIWFLCDFRVILKIATKSPDSEFQNFEKERIMKNAFENVKKTEKMKFS
jgi:cephalosporin-C deacetylase-like acetyl esterase